MVIRGYGMGGVMFLMASLLFYKNADSESSFSLYINILNMFLFDLI